MFRAAVTAFASLTRPSRNEIAQLEDLVLPLYDHVSVEARRFVAAVLSEMENPPAALVRRLADEKVDIAAPVLLRSNALADVDLIALIGRHGLGHARVIGKRPDLNPTIAQLIKALSRSEKRVALVETATEPDGQMKPAASARSAAPETQSLTRKPGAAAEEVRVKLRAMMRPAAPAADEWPRISLTPPPGLYAKLRDTALTGVRELFQTALADALGIDFPQARSITARSNFAELLGALKFLELAEEQALLVAAAVHPQQFGHAEAIRLFLERYRLIHREAAADKVRGWKAAAVATALKPAAVATALMPSAQTAAHAPANSPGRRAFGRAIGQ
ncbi:hypothetical protein SAZ10_04780 [Mesorhizobium sp. BAC0120]|uniref:hypothetical protein n=1 Tax=Mesorhizobium sp. BAC0120 TaxID=3090670 RepID=UPI00298C181B|nr:hypothetical protein [Mesorhizobium sp. BAC0120]MDW6021074.1 hypothetical protein [Mesorhizobium sp. BAC0120]